MNIYSCAPFIVIRAMNVLVFVALPAHVCWSSSVGHLFVHLWVSTTIRGSGLIGFCYYKSAEGPRWGQSMTPPSRVRYRYLHAPSSHAIKCIHTEVRIVATHHWPLTTVISDPQSLGMFLGLLCRHPSTRYCLAATLTTVELNKIINGIHFLWALHWFKVIRWRVIFYYRYLYGLDGLAQ